MRLNSLKFKASKHEHLESSFRKHGLILFIVFQSIFVMFFGSQMAMFASETVIYSSVAYKTVPWFVKHVISFSSSFLFVSVESRSTSFEFHFFFFHIM